MLVGWEGEFGVDGSSEVDGEDIMGWERSSARTTTAGVPLGDTAQLRSIWTAGVQESVSESRGRRGSGGRSKGDVRFIR